jgi:hypothetical protein
MASSEQIRVRIPLYVSKWLRKEADKSGIKLSDLARQLLTEAYYRPNKGGK